MSSAVGLLKPEDFVEGGLWGCYLGYQVQSLRDSVNQLRAELRLPSGHSEKVARIWQAKKEVLLNGALTASAASYFVSWFHEVGLIALGPLSAPVAMVGYGGSAASSSINLFGVIRELNQSIRDYESTRLFTEKRDIGLKQVDLMLTLAMNVAFVAWGVLGIAYVAVGGLPLFAAVDRLFVIGLSLLVVKFGYALFFLPSKKAATPS